MARNKLKQLITKVEKVLGAELSGFRSGLEPASRAERVLGFVVSTDFKKLDPKERRELLKGILNENLSNDELVLIGPIVTMTPAEADIVIKAA